ncbi:hypothetical protein MHU86_10575 [Fragilaria crotonensis]|nr:hypothetical protein MHU86_10575 [Fragilaria crotonensis]
MMRQRIPRWPRLHQDQEPPQELQQHQQRLHLEQRQQRVHQPQQRPAPHQRLPLRLEDDDDDDDGNSSDETYFSSRHHVTSRPPLPFSFRKRATTPTTTTATTPWNGGSIAIRVVNCESSVVDDDTVPTQVQLSDNEESDDDYDYDGFTVEGDEDTVYSTITVETKDLPEEPVTQMSSCKRKKTPETKDGDEDTFPDISDLIVNSCLSTSIGKELLDTYTDARDALNQVLHAFTLGEGEINCVCGRLNDAKTEFFHS